MSGIAALAAAAATTQKITTTSATALLAGTVKVVQSGALVSSAGGLVTTTQGVKVATAPQTVRLVSPGGQVLGGIFAFPIPIPTWMFRMANFLILIS